MVFNGDVSADGNPPALAIYLWEEGKETVAVARPGDDMPGGGKYVTASFSISGYDINQRGDVSFAAAIDTDGDDVSDETGVFVWSEGTSQLVARTGTVIPGLGTVDQILPPDLAGTFPMPLARPWAGEVINDNGEVVFHAALEDGTGVLLRAIPEPNTFMLLALSGLLGAAVIRHRH